MPEHDKSSLVETIARAIARRALGGLSRYAQQLLKRLLRLAGLYAAGVAVAIFGLAFLAVGVVKWLAMMVPSWLAWLVVGVVLLLLGVVLTLTAFLASKS
ncbi:phage holin family protein [[Eubacterium] cellulosolvens]